MREEKKKKKINATAIITPQSTIDQYNATGNLIRGNQLWNGVEEIGKWKNDKEQTSFTWRYEK